MKSARWLNCLHCCCEADRGPTGLTIVHGFGEGIVAVGMRLACVWLVTVLSEARMMGIPRRFSHFVYGVIQAGLTCAIAAAIASSPFLTGGTFIAHWLRSWLMMLPIVLFAAPVIRNLTHVLTRED